MSRFNNVLEAVGATPLIRLNHIGSEFGSEIFVKFEAVNPGGSIKDRVGRYIIEAAERKGLLKPGGIIIEATAGNTGAGLALAAAVKGYRLIVVMPDKMSAEKIALLKAFGAEVVITPTAVAPDSPENYIQKAKALAASIPNSFRAAPKIRRRKCGRTGRRFSCRKCRGNNPRRCLQPCRYAACRRKGRSLRGLRR